MTVISGAVESKIFANGAPPRLLEDSLYAQVERKFAQMAAGKDTEKDYNTFKEYPRALVGDLLGGAGGKVYRGEGASMVRSLTSWMPAFFLVSFPFC